MEPLKHCPECGEIVIGRRDKIFCDSSCKSRYFRRSSEGQEEETVAQGEMIQSVTIGRELTPIFNSEPDEEEDLTEWLAQRRREEKDLLAQRRRDDEMKERLQETQKRIQTLYQLYYQFVERFLMSESQPIYAKPLADFLQELDEGIQDYRKHPELIQAGDISHQRLADLYYMRDTLQDVQDIISRQGIFGSKSSYFELSKKKRNRLRLHLLE